MCIVVVNDVSLCVLWHQTNCFHLSCGFSLRKHFSWLHLIFEQVAKWKSVWFLPFCNGISWRISVWMRLQNELCTDSDKNCFSSSISFIYFISTTIYSAVLCFELTEMLVLWGRAMDHVRATLAIAPQNSFSKNTTQHTTHEKRRSQ